MPSIDNSKVSAKLAEVKKQLAENQQERLEAEPTYDRSLVEMNNILTGQTIILLAILEGRYQPDAKNPEGTGSKNKQPASGPRRTRAGG